MYSIILGLIFVAAFLWFNTSKKVKFPKREPWLEKLLVNKTLTYWTIGCLALISLFSVIWLQGFGAGIFAWITYAMGMLSLIVLLYPYKYFKYKHAFFLFCFIFLFEITFTYISSK